MNGRRAAGLVLLGWYLMLPPGNAKSVNTSALFAQWDHNASYDSASACENDRQEMREHFPTGDVVESRCIASDDARLKEK